MPLGGTTLFQYKSMKNAFQCKPENLEIRNGQPCCATASEAGRESGPPEGVPVYAWGQYGRPPVPRRWSGLAVQQEHSPVRGPPAARQRGLQDRVTRHSVVVGRGSPPPLCACEAFPRRAPSPTPAGAGERAPAPALSSALCQTALAEANAVATEAMGAMRTVAAFANEAREYKRYEQCIERNYKLQVKQTVCPGPVRAP